LNAGLVADPSSALDVAAVHRRVAAQIVGRDRELELLLAAVAARRDIVLEGPPGTSKTTMLKAIAAEWGIPLIFVEGNPDLTPSKLIGHHSPARVLQEGYRAENFEPGPLVEAMQTGGFLYIEEFNRAPEETLNTLLTAIAERTITIPRVGTTAAQPTFRIIASMNPYDNVGTALLSVSVRDRLCRLTVDYQDADAERRIVALRAEVEADDPLERLSFDAVAVTRATRAHADVRQGSSVRGAIDLVLVGQQLARVREIESCADERYPQLLLDAMVLALSGRIHVDEASERAPETILREIWEDLILSSASAEPG
jgi:MoxR-like ATPase